jgi:predicted TIM-barrel fold metal-dependent hydrolase
VAEIRVLFPDLRATRFSTCEDAMTAASDGASISEGRRQAIRTLGALPFLATLAGCPPSANNIAAGPPRIDAHCHVFNILDMPAYAFLLDVVVQNPFLKPIAAPFAKLLVEIIRAPAHSNGEEKAILQAHLINPTLFPLPVAAMVTIAPLLITSGLTQYIQKYTSIGISNVPLPTASDYDKLIRDYLLPMFLPSVKIDPTKTPQQNLQAILDGLQNLATSISAKQKNVAVNPEVSVPAYIAQFLAYWAPNLAEYRFVLSQNVAGLYNGAKPVFLCPSTLDIDKWLDTTNESPWTKMSDQAELMKLISLVQPDNRVLHGFIGFDPVRCIDDQKQNVHPNALEIVKAAIEQQGFIGVKLYPPMGFRAIGNASAPALDFSTLPGVRPYVITPQMVDAALTELYDYCNTNEVPIMAHCAPSQGPTPQASEQAHPKWWAQLLDDAKYKSTLRVNLGHFGGVWDFDGTAHTPAPWTAEIADMIQTGGYGFLYTDLGDFANILDRDGTDRWPAISNKLTSLLTTDTLVRDRILYGTDWLMLGIEPGCDKYYDKMNARIAPALGVTNLDPLLGGNAVRYLGLAPGQKARMRLETFYTTNNKDPKKLNLFAA